MASGYNTYELTYIINSVISDNQIKDLISRVETYVTENGGEVVEVDQWGTRRLAYPIMKKRNGFYVNMVFRAAGSIILRLERALEIDDNVLRYLTMKMDAKMIRYYKEQKSTRSSLAPVEDKPRSDTRRDRTKQEGTKKAVVPASDGANKSADLSTETTVPEAAASEGGAQESGEPDSGAPEAVAAESNPTEDTQTSEDESTSGGETAIASDSSADGGDAATETAVKTGEDPAPEENSTSEISDTDSADTVESVEAPAAEPETEPAEDETKNSKAEGAEA